MATIMPHGVLFRGGEEKEARKHFIERGWLEAVVGLPAGLFYGTGIPACVLVVPIAEIDALGRFWENYPGLRERVFAPKVPAASRRSSTPGHHRSPSLPRSTESAA